MSDEAPASGSVRATNGTDNATSSHDSSHGARGYPVPLSQGSGHNYMADAEAIVGMGKPLTEFTDDEHRQVLALAIDACKRAGIWPEKHAPPAPVLCKEGHEHNPNMACPVCKKIKERRAEISAARVRAANASAAVRRAKRDEAA